MKADFSGVTLRRVEGIHSFTSLTSIHIRYRFRVHNLNLLSFGVDRVF